MFSGIPQKNRVAATTYFDEHLSHNDYYTQGETQAGHWIGIGSEKLGLEQGEVVTREAFLQLCDNRDPKTGQQLTLQQFRERRIYFDFVCSPPKSVSILAVTMNDQRIIQAHKEASTIALRELEQFATTRIRKGGIEDRDRITGNLVGAAFLHTTSRALDPLLHTHFVLFNCTWDQTEGRWKALQTGDMFGALNYGTEVYRNELVKQLHRFGYQTRKVLHGFEIEGVSPKLIERFSKRSQQRDRAVQRQEQKFGRKLTKQEIAHVVHQTRPKKLKGASDAQVREQQLDEIGFFEKRSLRNVVKAAPGQPQDLTQPVETNEAICHAIAHVFERNSVVPQHRILQAALVKGCGQLNLEQLKGRLAKDAKLVRVGSEFSTRDILTKELFLIRTVNAGVQAVAPFTNCYEPSDRFGPDQRTVLFHLLTSSDRFTGFRGLAGTGKSTTLVELDRVLHKEGLEPVFCAPTASATETLRKDKLEAVTLQKLLVDPNAERSLSTRSVIVVDEAAAVGLDDMVKLFELALRSRCRVVLSGDTGQHASVTRGDALRILEDYSHYRFGQLTTIHPQKPQTLRQVVELAAAKKTAEAFQKLVQLSAVTEAPTDGPQENLYDKAADAYLSAVRKGKTALLISPTWAEIEAVTDKVRLALKAEGVVSQQEEAVAVFDSLSWTEARKKDASLFESGQKLRFIRATKTFAKGQTAEVLGVHGHTLKLRRADGNEVTFSPGRSAGSFDVGEVRELQVAAGDTLLLQANAPGFVNGERVQVKTIREGRITLTDGRQLPADFNAFTHGYAVTSHSSQGRTVDEVFLVASSRSLGAVNCKQFYVSISRARERCHIFTDDCDLLVRRIQTGGHRKAAVELEALRGDLARLGFFPSVRQTMGGSTVGKTSLAPIVPDSRFRTMRPLRVLRPTRLSSVQRLVRVAEQMRQWLGDKLGVEYKDAAAEQIQRTETVEQKEKIEPTVKQTPAERARKELSKSIRHAIKRRPGNSGQSRGIGV